MQTSLDPRDWKEDSADMAARSRATLQTPTEELRRLFPLSGKFVGSPTLQYIPKDTLLKYVRTKMTPDKFPVIVLYQEQRSGATRCLSLRSEEIELLRPYENA